MPPAALPYRRWLHVYAMTLVVLTFSLVAVGGTVTSRGAGLAVPDWPTTFGYNMILAPLHVWWEQSDTFWEHFHRLMGSLVGLWAIGLALWLAVTQRWRPWLPAMGFALLGLVIAQGVMGGLRVTELSITWAIAHGITGQIILGLTVLVAAATSRVWLDRATPARSEAKGGIIPTRALRSLAIALLVLLIAQLVLGAMVRHTGAALAIPDFPAHYGQIVPPLTQPGIDAAVAEFPRTLRPYTVADVALHFAHRLGAGVVTLVALALILWLNLRAPGRPETKWPARWLMGLLGAQIALGASVVWSGRYPEMATAHQAVGAALLAVATWLTIRVHLLAHASADAEPGGDAASPRAAHPGGGEAQRQTSQEQFA